VIGLQLVDKPELHAVADAEAPVDRVIRRAGVPVDELPARVLGRGDPIDVDRVVFPLDPTKRFVVGRVLMTTVPVAVVMTVAVAFAVTAVSAAATSAAGSGFMPQLGQLPGSSLTMSGASGRCRRRVRRAR
jgi:hypothetical protein